MHDHVRIVACDLDDSAAAGHADETLSVGRPRDTKYLENMLECDGSDQKRTIRARTVASGSTVYTVFFVVILMMRIVLSMPPVATIVPSGEIAHASIYNRPQHPISKLHTR